VINLQVPIGKKKIYLPPLSRKGFVTNYPPFPAMGKYGGRNIIRFFHKYLCAYCYYKTNGLKDKKAYLDR